MRLVKLYSDESNYTQYELNDTEFCQFLIEHKHLLSDGFRIYDSNVAEDCDITLSPNRIATAKEIIIIRPALAAVGAWIIANWVMLAVMAVSMAVTMVMASNIDAPSTSNRSQSSSTNSLGSRENKPRIGERVDDVWGYVSHFAPALIQMPHSRYEDNVQVERFAMACMGKGLQENHRDGETPFKYLSNASFYSWSPKQDLTQRPDESDYGVVIGKYEQRPINSITPSAELQSQELLPPNDLEVTGAEWTVTSEANSATITLSNAWSLEVDLNDYFAAGVEIYLNEAVAAVSTRSKTLYRHSSSSGEVDQNFQIVTSTELLDGLFDVISVTESSITIDTTDMSWQLFTNADLMTFYANAQLIEGAELFTDTAILDYVWYETKTTEGELTDRVVIIDSGEYLPAIGNAFNSQVGPISVKENCDIVTLNFVSSSGFYDIVKGNDRRLEANIRITLQETDEDGEPTGNEIVTNNTYITNTKSITSQAALTVDIENPYQYSQIICRRTTDRNKSSNVANVDRIDWQDLYFEDIVPLPDNTDVTIMQAQIPSSTTARSVKERLINFDWTRVFAPYVGNARYGAEVPVDTWAETLIGMALDKYNGRLTLDNIDADTLLDVQREMIAYYGTEDCVKVGYDFDSTKIRFQEAYKLLCTAVNASGYAQCGKFKAYANIDRIDSSKQFTHRTILPDTYAKNRTWESEYDGVELTFRNGETGKFETVVRHVNGNDSNNRYQLELSGAITEAQATIRANRELNYIKFQKYSYGFDADSIARLTVPGERVDSVDMSRIAKREHNMNHYKIYSGYVVEVNGLEIELSEEVYFDDGEVYSIRFTGRKGNLLEVIGCKAGKSSRHVILSSAPSEAIYSGYRQEKTNFTLASDSQKYTLPMIVRSVKAKSNNDFKARSLNCINYDNRYFADDKEFSKIA